MTTTPPSTGTSEAVGSGKSNRPGESLSVAQGAALSIGAVLGTGVITLPALAAHVAGPASLVAWAALVLLSIPLARTFGTLGSRHPDPGGVATYVRLAFGNRAAAVVGWCFYFAIPVGAPPASMMAGGYIADVVGGGQLTTLTVAAVLIVVTGSLNLLGLRISGRVQLVLAGILALLMTATMVVALPHASITSLTPFVPNGWKAVGEAAAVLVWGFAGWEAVASLAGDYRNPRRDVPRATTIAVTVVGVLYLALATTSVLVLGPAAGDSTAPLSDLIAITLGDKSRVITAVVALLLTLGAMNAYFAGGSRLGAALARDGALPEALAKGAVHSEVPRRSITLITLMSLASIAVTAVLHLSLTLLLLLATGCFTLVYVLGTAAALRLLERWSAQWWTAAVAFISVSGLLILGGLHTLWAIACGAAALGYQAWSKRSSCLR